jgi:hypothetical protein
MTDRDTYYQTCIEQGLSPDAAGRLADGLMASKARQAEGAPGWETLAAKTPAAIRERAQQLFALSDKSNPNRDPSARLSANVQSVFAFGVLAGMLLGDQGLGPNKAEVEASRVNLPELWQWLCSLDNGPFQCPDCGHLPDGPYPWWDGNGKCPKCGGLKAELPPELRSAGEWGRAVLHPQGWDGEEGLLMPFDDESPEDCIKRYELGVGCNWREVRARRASVSPSKCSPLCDVDDMTEQLDEWISDGNRDDWHAAWGTQIIFAEVGADDALRAALDAWAYQYLRADAWVIHPEDRKP